MNRSFLNYVSLQFHCGIVSNFLCGRQAFIFTIVSFLRPKRQYLKVLEDFVWKQIPKTSFFFAPQENGDSFTVSYLWKLNGALEPIIFFLFQDSVILKPWQ